MGETLPASRQWSAYQAEIYTEGLKGILPNVTTDANKLENQARGHLSNGPYNYVAG